MARSTVWSAGRRGSAVAVCVLTLAAGPAAAQSPLADAAMKGDLEAVRARLAEDADPNAAQGDGMRPHCTGQPSRTTSRWRPCCSRRSRMYG